MRIDELDPKHKEFKQVILDHELTEEQLDEILPAIAMAGAGLARGALAVGNIAARGVGAVARGVGAVARGVGQAASAVGRGVGQAARSVGTATRNTASNMGQKAKTSAKDQINKKVKSFAQDTANKLSNQGNDSSSTQGGTQGTQGTIGTDQSEQPQADLKRGTQISVPQTDPKNPGKSIPTAMKVKSVTGSNVELEPEKKQKGQPSVVKFNKKDLQLQ